MPYFSLSSDDYKKHFLTGFAHLQEEQDFVDLTIAVDGHLVKVHKNVIALASPYLRDIMKKSPSENLVIYLNCVNYKDFSFLLEYIYQGEVNVPEERLQCFIQLAQSLHITGIADSVTSDVTCLPNKQSDNTYLESSKLPTDLTDNNFEENNSTEFVTACGAVKTDHNYVGHISESIQVSNREQEFATKHDSTNLAAVEIKLAGESIYNTELEDLEEKIPIDETNYTQGNSNIKENAIPVNTILEPYEITLHSEEAGNIIPASIIDTNNILSDIEMTDNIATINKEMATNIPTDTNQVDSCIFEIARDKGIPLNSIAKMKDDEIPTDIHIVISKPNDADTDENKPYAVTVKPLSSLKDAEVLPTVGSDFQFDKDSVDALKVLTQFSVTERGCIQIIVSRYIYNSHHVAHRGRKRRWRCADYRKKKCPAIIDSLDNNIVLRKGIHNHTYHDDKIYRKHNKSQIFNTLKQAENYRNKPSIETVNPEGEDIAKLIDVKHTKKK